MELGYIQDLDEGRVLLPKWIRGAFELNFWGTGKTKGMLAHFVVTYRCTQCGFLESYAEQRAN